MTVVICPVCRGWDDRPEDLCSMCSDPGMSNPGEWCSHEVWEQFNRGCDCPPAPCSRCGAEQNDGDDACWKCGE